MSAPGLLRALLALALLVLADQAFAELRFETYRARFTNDDDAIAAAIADAKTGPDPVITFYGQITVRRPLPLFDRVHLVGRDIYGSVVAKAYPGGVLFRFDGRDGHSGGGLHNFSIAGNAFNNGAYAILGRSRPGYGPHGVMLERLYIGAGFYRAIELVGYDNPSVPGQLGVRQPRIWDVTVFGTQAPWSVYLHWTSDARVESLRLYPAGGSYADLAAVPANNPGVVVAP